MLATKLNRFQRRVAANSWTGLTLQSKLNWMEPVARVQQRQKQHTRKLRRKYV